LPRGTAGNAESETSLRAQVDLPKTQSLLQTSRKIIAARFTAMLFDGGGLGNGAACNKFSFRLALAAGVVF
jgi:hypothetical protein